VALPFKVASSSQAKQGGIMRLTRSPPDYKWATWPIYVASLPMGNNGGRCPHQPCRDVRPVRHVSSITISPVRPSPPSQHHPGYYNAVSDVVEARGNRTPPCPLLCPLQPPISCTLESAYGQRLNGKLLRRHPRSRSWEDTGHAMTLRQKQDLPGWPSTPLHCTPCHHA
jgi:hypothetical protein